MLTNLRLLLLVPVLVAYRVTDQRVMIDADVDRWIEVGRDEQWWWWRTHESVFGADHARALLGLFRNAHAFRDLFYYRMMRGHAASRAAAVLLRHVLHGEPGLTIACPAIGPGLYIAHGFSTFIAAKRIGSRCRIHQNVTIGWDKPGEAPIIEDDVTIFTGAVVVGNIVVGSRSVIGANAFVKSNVPAGHMAVGVPAQLRPLRGQ